MDVLIRQAHPGGKSPPYRRLEHKLSDARAYQDEEGLPWPVLADDLEGSVHRAWGGLSDPAYLLDRDGRVSFYCAWTSPRALGRAMQALLAQGGTGIVRGGLHRSPQLGPVLADGWRAVQRGLPGSAVDLMVTIPFSPVALWAGYQLKPLLWPKSRRPLPQLRPRALLLGATLLSALSAVALGLLARQALRSAQK